ncbi:amino acid transporter [Scytonema tolypothrichoides VB-61278]|nr:amino acid transporter [Scytonema tolypothrichoides VB-61278]
MISAFIHGIILAFGLILPLGPQNVFVFTQGATQPRLFYALPIALVASLSDTLLILLAVLGVSVVVLSLPWVKTVLVVGGVLFLCYIGWITWKSDEETNGKSNNASNWSLKQKILFTLSVSLLNPHAILDTIGVIGTSSLSYTGLDKVVFTLTCISVSWLWFFTLTVVGRLVGTFKHTRKMFNRVSAVIMWLSALYLVYNFTN